MKKRYKAVSKTIVLSLFLLMGFGLSMQAQDSLRIQPKFWFGASVAGNLNLYTGTTQTLKPGIKVPAAFHEGLGLATFASFMMEYRPDPVWGLMLNLGYDNRGGKFDRKVSPCNCPEDLKTDLSYLTIEPSLRIAPFKSGFYIFLGGVYGYNVNKSFKYTFVRDVNNPLIVKSDFSDVNQHVFSAQVGAGYEIPLSAKTSRTQLNLSPFISYHPYFGQEPRTIESWSVSKVRVGIALKFGRGHAETNASAQPEEVIAVVPTGNEVDFSFEAPSTIPLRREVNETFPIRNYVFFDEGSTEIPGRYVKLNKEEANNFQEGQFLEPAPKDLNGRAHRQLSVYYNVLNILGKRMVENSNARITLIGSSAGKGPVMGKELAESVKSYLVDVFGINPSRITTVGRNQPIIASEKPGGTIDVALLRDGDRRVDIVSTMPDLLTPIQLTSVPVDPKESLILFKTVSKSNEPLKSWTLTFTDESGVVQNYGPFSKEKEGVSGNDILGDRASGTYEVVMTGQKKDGSIIKRTSTLNLVHGAAPKEANLRFSILFDFNKSKSVATYEKFLNETVVPLVPDNGSIIIHGHTDIIGDEAYNMKLSNRRANDARIIMESALSKAGKKGVNVTVNGFGENVENSPFENKFPEERFYNRTVIIEIVPSL